MMLWVELGCPLFRDAAESAHHSLTNLMVGTDRQIRPRLGIVKQLALDDRLSNARPRLQRQGVFREKLALKWAQLCHG